MTTFKHRCHVISRSIILSPCDGFPKKIVKNNKTYYVYSDSNEEGWISSVISACFEHKVVSNSILEKFIKSYAYNEPSTTVSIRRCNSDTSLNIPMYDNKLLGGVLYMVKLNDKTSYIIAIFREEGHDFIIETDNITYKKIKETDVLGFVANILKTYI